MLIEIACPMPTILSPALSTPLLLTTWTWCLLQASAEHPLAHLVVPYAPGLPFPLRGSSLLTPAPYLDMVPASSFS